MTVRKLIPVFLGLVLCNQAKAQDQNLLSSSDTVVWAGLDYSMVKMIGRAKSESGFGFTERAKIFPAMPVKWNLLFLGERIEAVSKALGKNVEVDINAVTERNKTISTNQIILTKNLRELVPQPNVTVTDIANTVREYSLQKTNGLGLVFVVDKLIESSFSSSFHNPNSGAVFVVLFDISSRKILYANREEFEIKSGASFQNFWFGPIKDADETLIKFQPPKQSAPSSPIRPRSR